jgi:hypothetical protein
MKILKRFVPLMLLAGGLCVSVFAQAPSFSGEVDYLEGEVSVHRDGEILQWPDVDIGLLLERYDLVETGMDGYAEVMVTRETGHESMVRVMQDTAFYFTVESMSTGDRVQFELLGGSLGLKVQKLTGTGVTVATESAVLGVRGTDFTVTVAPEGSILVTCTEGQVACRNAMGQEFLAEPGRAVEQLRNKQLRELPVDPETIRGFADDWYRQKLDGFVPNAPAIIKGYARQYLEYLDRFNPAYQELMQHNRIFQRWAQDTRAGRSTGEAVKDKIEVSPALFRMRRVVFLLEREFFRISNLYRVYQRYDIAPERLWSGYSTDEFFREFQKQRRTVAWKLSQVRYILKLYEKIDRASTPFGSGMPEPIDPMGDVFGDDNPF